MRRGDDYRLIPEMMWKVDENVASARRLPNWPRFHRACGERGLFFDNIERRDRRDTYKCVAFTIEKRANGYPHQVFLAEGSGKSVLDALGDAFAKAEYDIPEAAALLAAGLQGPHLDYAGEPLPEGEFRDPPESDFDALMEDEFEELL
jgi:hypothetical protein